jgi:Uma2 family endonuclease
MAVQEKLYTADDLWELAFQDKHFELSKGVLVEMPPTGDEHGIVGLWLGSLIVIYVDAHDLGQVFGAETGFVLSRNPDTVRAPDVAFVSKARLKPLTGKFYDGAPDLAVEVVSPTDTASQIRRKAAEYLEAGTKLLWIVYPDGKNIDVYQPGSTVEILTIDDTLEGGDVLPGFHLPVRDVFKRLLA